MIRSSIVALLTTLLPTSSLVAQVPGEYPHLVLRDSMGTEAPPAAGPFDSTGVLQAFSGLPFEAEVTYAAAGQPNDQVAWALILSGAKTPFPETLIPPPLFTMPPFVFITPQSSMLSLGGKGLQSLAVPNGVYFAESYVQALVYDSTSSPRLQLSNGVKIEVTPPGFSVSLAYIRNAATSDQLGSFGKIELGDAELNTLKPFGALPPPLPVPADIGGDPAEGSPVGVFRFEPLAVNAWDRGPVNTLERVMGNLAANLTTDQTSALIKRPQGFPGLGRAWIAHGTGTTNVNPYGPRVGDPPAPPRMEVVSYESVDRGFTPARLDDLERDLTGTTGANALNHTASNALVFGDFTSFTTSAGLARTRIGLNARNHDTPRVTIPTFTFTPQGETEPVTMSLDLFRYGDAISSDIEDVEFIKRGFAVLDRETNEFRLIQGTTRSETQGRWNPQIALSPDGRFFVAGLHAPPGSGTLGWDNRVDELWAIRTDGEAWPATGLETWRITWTPGQNPTQEDVGVASRGIWMPFVRILGPDPDNYVLFAGLQFKFEPSNLGDNFLIDDGYEGAWTREEIIVSDVFECPMTPPGSAKAVPSFPRAFITDTFPVTGFNDEVSRFDPYPLVNESSTMMMVAGGLEEGREDVYVVRNISVLPDGTVSKLIANVSGHRNNAASAGQFGAVDVRRFFTTGYVGHGAKAAFSPSSNRCAWVVKDNTDTSDWIQIARTNGLDFGKVLNVYQDLGTETFEVNGDLLLERAITDLRFIDEDRLLFFMGRAPYAVNATVRMDLFSYEISTDTLTNLTRTGGSAVFDYLDGNGTVRPGGSFLSPNREFFYFVRGGSFSGTAKLANIVGVSLDDLTLFSVTGNEFGAVSTLPSLVIPTDENTFEMDFTEGTGAQQGMVYFKGHVANGNGADEVFGLNADFPFVTFQLTDNVVADSHVTNITPSPYSLKVALSRSSDDEQLDANQHPYVIDIDAFMFERDLLPGIVQGGVPVGRVMDDSFHFIGPSSTAGEALVFTFGAFALNDGTANLAPPAYYPLANVSNVFNEPVPVIIPLVDTLLLGTNFRFYVLSANAGP